MPVIKLDALSAKQYQHYFTALQRKLAVPGISGADIELAVKQFQEQTFKIDLPHDDQRILNRSVRFIHNYANRNHKGWNGIDPQQLKQFNRRLNFYN